MRMSQRLSCTFCLLFVLRGSGARPLTVYLRSCLIVKRLLLDSVIVVVCLWELVELRHLFLGGVFGSMPHSKLRTITGMITVAVLLFFLNSVCKWNKENPWNHFLLLPLEQVPIPLDLKLPLLSVFICSYLSHPHSFINLGNCELGHLWNPLAMFWVKRRKRGPEVSNLGNVRWSLLR